MTGLARRFSPLEVEQIVRRGQEELDYLRTWGNGGGNRDHAETLRDLLLVIAERPSLTGTRQETPAGCMYHAAEAILGIPAGFARYRDDISRERWICRLASRGFFPLALYDATLTQIPLGPASWQELRERAIDPAGSYPVLLTIRSKTFVGFHMVAALIPGPAAEPPVVTISDSKAEEKGIVFSLPWETFVESEYGEAFAVEILISTEIHDHAPNYAAPVPREGGRP